MATTRRDLLQAGAALSAAALLPAPALADGASFQPEPGRWRTFELTTRIAIRNPSGKVRGWVPLPGFEAAGWNRPLTSNWRTNGQAVAKNGPHGAKMLVIDWGAAKGQPVAEIVTTVATRDRATSLVKRSQVSLSAEQRNFFTAPTRLIPTDGIVKRTADKITAGAGDDLGKARRIYEWVVTNTFRDPKTHGCGLGDIRMMLETGDLGGKCADLNALFVGLARASGLPARDLYGIRVAPSRFGYKSLGANSQDVTKSQHCRADVYLSGIGWVPVDPADVRKVVLEEPPGKLSLSDPKVAAARHALFGAWEGNWIAYNGAQDVSLPGGGGEPLGFLMYPQAVNGGATLNCLEPDDFRYSISAKEII